MDGMHGERHQSHADAAASVCEQCTCETCVLARYRTIYGRHESVIDIAISCNRYDHYKRVPFRHCRGVMEWRLMGVDSAFLSLVTLTCDLNIQTRPSEGLNASSLWIWHESVQRFPRYLSHKQNEKKSNRQC